MTKTFGKPDIAWYRRHLDDGGVYYSPSRRSHRKVILAGPGDREPTPAELAEILSARPDAEIERGAKFLVEYDADESSENSVQLPCGFYSYERRDHASPERLEPMEVREDFHLKLPGVPDRLLSDVSSFLSGERIYREMGIQYRRGILLYGPPGNGKTSLIREIIRTRVPKEAVVIFMDRIPSRHFVQVIQKTLSQTLKVIVFEELAATLRSSELDQVLAFLDGEMSLDKCLIFGTTNYPSQLPGNIVDRPSRFDRLYKIGDPNDEARAIFAEHFLGRKIDAIENAAMKGLSTAAIREACILVRMREISLLDASAILISHHELVKKEFGAVGEIGLRPRNRFDEYVCEI